MAMADLLVMSYDVTTNKKFRLVEHVSSYLLNGKNVFYMCFICYNGNPREGAGAFAKLAKGNELLKNLQ